MDNTTKQSRTGGRSYMMRSEKRPGFDGRPPRKKAPKHRLYKALTIVLLLVCYPVGLVLLWRGTIRWNGFKKLFVSIISLIVCFALLSVALLTDFGNPTVKKGQDAVLALLDTTREGLTRMGEGANQEAKQAGENWRAVTENLPGILVAAGNQALREVQQAIATPSPEPTATPVPTATPEPTKAPRQKLVRETEEYLSNRARYAVDIALKGQSDLPPEALEEPTMTPEPTATPAPEGTQEPQADTAGGSLTPPPEQDVTAPPQQATATQAPTRMPIPTATPTPAPRIYAADSAVYYTTTGVSYHSSPVCGTMTQGRQHTVAEALEAGKQRCKFCGPVPESYADKDAWLVWLDQRNCWHLTSECAQAQGETTEMLFTDLPAQDGILIACTVCGASQYEGELPDEVRNRANDPEQITNGNTLVYFNEQDAYYHTANKCSSNVQMTFTAHKLSDAVIAGKQPCPHCNPPEATFQ